MGLGCVCVRSQVGEVILSPASVDWAPVPLHLLQAKLVCFSLGPSWAERVNFDVSEQAWRGSMQIHTLS